MAIQSLLLANWKIMFGTTLIFVVAVALVATYILIVNRMLRSDEHWNESDQLLTPASRQHATVVVTPTARTAALEAKHV